MGMPSEQPFLGSRGDCDSQGQTARPLYDTRGFKGTDMKGNSPYVGDNRGSIKGESLVPVQVGGLKSCRTTGVACGNKHTLACTDAGKLYSWGSNSHGQLGQGDKLRRDLPDLVESMRQARVVSVSAGSWHSACIAVMPSGGGFGSTAEGEYLSEDSSSDEDGY